MTTKANRKYYSKHDRRIIGRMFKGQARFYGESVKVYISKMEERLHELLATFHGIEEGQTCNRDGCCGVIEQHPVEDCSCHISPPCHNCTEPKEYCPVCDWEAADEPVDEESSTRYESTRYEPRPLDPTKIDWRSTPHSSCSMIKEGVYPEGTTIEEVRKVVDGTFGGAFEYFRDGKFKFIAYTD